MTFAANPTPAARGIAPAFWYAVVALLFAVQSTAGTAWQPALTSAVEQAARVAAPVPPATQVRDAAKLVQVTARGFTAAHRPDASGGDPAMAGSSFAAIVPPGFAAGTHRHVRQDDPRAGRPAERYRARAPPRDR